MGLLDKLFAEFIDIIEWIEKDQETFVYRFERYDNEIKNGAQLIVRPGQLAILVNEGQLADTFKPGTHTLSTQNMPILSTLKGWKYGFSSPFKVEVYFFSIRIFNQLKWGTPNPVIKRDSELGVVRLRARGQFSFQLTGSPAKFLTDFVGTRGTYGTEDVFEMLRGNIVMAFADMVGSDKVPLLDLASQYMEYSATLKQTAEGILQQYGFSVPILTIEAITVPPEVEAMLDKRSSMSIVGQNNFTEFQAGLSLTQPGAASTLKDSMGFAMGMNMANQMMNNQANQQAAKAAAPAQPQAGAPAAGGPPPLPGSVQYYWAIGSNRFGPLPLENLATAIQQGQANAQTLVWYQGLDAWKPASAIPEVAALLANTPPPLPV